MRVASTSFCCCVSFIAARMASAKSMFMTCILVEKVGASAHAIGECVFDLLAGMKGAEHGDRFNGRHSKRSAHIGCEARQPEHLDVKLLAGGFHRLQILARVVPQAELERVPHDGLFDFLAMSRKLVADRRANKVRSVGIKALVDQEIDMAEVDITEVDGDLFGLARFLAKTLDLCSHRASPSIWMLYGWLMDGIQGHAPRPKRRVQCIEASKESCVPYSNGIGGVDCSIRVLPSRVILT